MKLGRLLPPAAALLSLGLLSCDDPPPPAPCPDDMVEIAAAEVVVGHPQRTHPWQGLQRTASLSRYCIDRFEYPNRSGELPRVEVSWNEAESLCAARGRRLCSSDEWERACRGLQGWDWSYGPTFDPARCNTPLQGADGPGEAGIPLAPSGSFAHCRSPEGVHDLNGNVAEWVADAWDTDVHGLPGGASQARTLDEAPVKTEPLAAPPGDYRSLRGGTMWSETFYGQSCHSRHAHPRTSPADDDGFRCCVGP